MASLLPAEPLAAGSSEQLGQAPSGPGWLDSLKGLAADIIADARSGLVSTTATGIAAAVRSGAAPAVAEATRALVALRLHGFVREVVESLVQQGEAPAAGQLCLAAVRQGPEAAEAIRQVSVQLLLAGPADWHVAAVVAVAFWEAACRADGSSAAGTGSTAGATPAVGGAVEEVPGEAPADGSQATTSPPPAPAQLTTAEAQQSAAVLLAAAVVEAVQRGEEAGVVAVTEELLGAGRADLVRALVAAMVEAGHGEEAGKISVAALAAGKHGLVSELSAALASGNQGAVLGTVAWEATKEGARQLGGRAAQAAGRLMGGSEL